jgi:hypothetical protein
MGGRTTPPGVSAPLLAGSAKPTMAKAHTSGRYVLG